MFTPVAASRLLRRKIPCTGHLMTPRRLWIQKVPTQVLVNNFISINNTAIQLDVYCALINYVAFVSISASYFMSIFLINADTLGELLTK